MKSNLRELFGNVQESDDRRLDILGNPLLGIGPEMQDSSEFLEILLREGLSDSINSLCRFQKVDSF